MLTPDARAVVLLVDGTAGPAEGTTVASVSIKNPGPQPVAFQLAYPFSQINPSDTYRLYAGIVDGDLAWVTPIGVNVAVPQPLIEGVVLPLEYRPDLLKAAVTGTITGVGLDPARDPDSYGTSLVIEVNTGATIGFQLIEPAGAAPVPYSVPFDPSTITPSADYVARASVWDGTTLWNTPVGVPVITNSNPKSDVVLTVTPGVTPSPSPSPAPAPAPSGGDNNTVIIVAILAIIILLVIGGYAYMRSKSASAAGTGAAGAGAAGAGEAAAEGTEAEGAADAAETEAPPPPPAGPPPAP